MFGELLCMGMKICWLEKGQFDEIIWRLVIRRRILLLIESRVFHINGARCFGFEFISLFLVTLYFTFLLFQFSLCCWRSFYIGAHNNILSLNIFQCHIYLVFLNYHWPGLSRVVAVFRVFVRFCICVCIGFSVVIYVVDAYFLWELIIRWFY